MKNLSEPFKNLPDATANPNPTESAGIDPKIKLEWKKISLDRAKLKFERDKLLLEQKKFENESHHRRASQTNLYATTAIKNTLIINGAAAIATLTFMSNTSKSGVINFTDHAISGSFVFGIGVFTSSFCATLAYGARATYKGEGPKPVLSKFIETLSWIFGLVALFCFPIGAWEVGMGISNVFRNTNAIHEPRFLELERKK